MRHFSIKYGDKIFEASEYQDKIFNNVISGSGNMIISAAAGASKTTTIINCMDLIPEKKRVLFIAFNRDIVNSIKSKINNKNAHISTFHSLGYMILLENGIINRDDQINEFKYRNYIKNNIDNISLFHETKSLSKNRITYINNISNLVEYSRYYLAFSIKEITKIAEKYGITPIRDEIPVTREVLKWGEENLDTIDYTDMMWLPNVLNINTKKYCYDWILIDEAQDTSIAEQQLVEKCFKRGTRFIAVGDDHQKINVWCGASEEAINKFKEKPNTVEYTLPISYRCPKKIVELAKKYSDNIISAPDAIKGTINYNVSENAPTNGDMVLCRTTAPLVELHLKYNRLNKKSYIRGFENIKTQYLDLINGTFSKTIDKNCLTSNGMFPRIYEKLFNEIDMVKKTYGLDDDDAMSHPKILSMYDAIEGIKAVSDGLSEVKELTDKINIIFSGDENDAIQLSTVHKAKGLEADNVFILLPSLMPSKMAKKDWEIKTEQNLLYVAITRSKKTLNFIEEGKNTFMAKYNGVFDLAKMKNELNEIKIKIKYNKDNSIIEGLPNKKMGNSLSKPQKLTDNKQPISNKRVKKAGLRLQNLLQ